MSEEGFACKLVYWEVKKSQNRPEFFVDTSSQGQMADKPSGDQMQ